MNYKQFVDKYNGRYLDYDKAYGYQCVDVMRAYVKEVYGLNPYVAIPTTGYAKNIFNNFKTNKYFKKILNTPNGMPKQGDIIFWGYYPALYGWSGHVGLYNGGDLYTIISFDQNYPTGRHCQFVKHGYNKWLHGYRGCLGWLRRI